MVVTDRDDVAKQIKVLRSHGMTSLTWDRHRGHAFTYDVVALGNNYRMDEIRSALGLEQLKKLTRGNTIRKAITTKYHLAFQQPKFTGIELPFLTAPGKPSYHIFPMLLPKGADRRVFMESMRAAGVQTSIHYPPIHTFTYYRQRYPTISLPETDAVARREVTLPLYPTMTDEQVNYVISAAANALEASLSKVPVLEKNLAN